MYYWIYALLLIIIAILVIFMLLQRKKYVSRLSKDEQMLLVRDQIGIAPLFYNVTDGMLVFASEIKAILECPWVERRLNLKAVDQLMNYPGVVSPETFFLRPNIRAT